MPRFFISASPDDDFSRWEAQREKQLAKLPKCYECGEPIQDDECYEINDELICPKCLEDNHRKFTDDYTDE